MADPATVEVEDEGVVTVDVSDNPDLANGEGAETVLSLKEMKDAATAKAAAKLESAPKAATVTAADEAAAALTQAVKTEEEKRKAAEATAQAERRGREEAQRLAAQKDQEAQSYREQAESSQLTILNNGIENSKRDVESAQSDLERAMEAGEFSKASAAQVKLSKAAAALDRLEAAKADFEAGARKAPVTEGRVEAPVQQQMSPFEQYVSGFAPTSQAWLRAHSDCVPSTVGGNTTKNNKMMAGHFDALAQDLKEGTPEYFRVIEEHLGERAPVSTAATLTPAGEERTESAPKPRRAPVPAAPVSRDTPAATGARVSRTVTLTAQEQEMAKMSFPQLPVPQALAQYARNKIELEAEGKLGRTSH